MKTALITGVSGQDGSYLAELLVEKGYKVYGLNRRKSKLENSNLVNIINNENFILVDGDLSEVNRLNSIVKDLKPDEIYNLAAQSFVPYSWTHPIYTCDVNALGVIRLLEAIKHYSPNSRFYQASSSEIFGKVNEFSENELTYHYPRSPYGCSKSFGFNITRNYRESFNLFCCNGILFNHESERRGLQFVTRKITRTVAEINAGISDKLILGNLDAKRDWGYSPDYVEAMWIMLQQNKPDDYVIATGEEHTVKEFVELAFKEIDIHLNWNGKGVQEKGFDRNTQNILVESTKEFYRPAEVDILRGDPSKAEKKLGWKPKVSFHDMIKKMVSYDLKQLNIYNK